MHHIFFLLLVITHCALVLQSLRYKPYLCYLHHEGPPKPSYHDVTL